MREPRLHIVSPELVADFVERGPGHNALETMAKLAGAKLVIERGGDVPRGDSSSDSQSNSFLIRYNGRPMGQTLCDPHCDAESLVLAAAGITSVMEHMLDREMAIVDLADAMVASYEELNMLYSLLPNVATRIHENEIAEALVEQTAKTLCCDRVSLLVLDEEKSSLKVAASRGLPDEVSHLSIPVGGSIAEHTLSQEDLLVVDDIADRPDLAGMSKGCYDSNAFAAVRVPLRARGEGLGVLAVTERQNGSDFTARDRKLLEGLSAMGASALLNCRLHSAVNRQMLSTIEALASAVDAKDAYTHNHSARVAEMCLATAKALGVTDRKSCRDIELAGLLHDIGKIGIPDAILQKPGRLSPDEYRLIKSHVTTGANIVNKVEGLEKVAEAILRHHERYDGLGYPGGLSGDAIPLASKLIAIVDTYDSLTTDRPYRKSLGVEHAVTELRRCTGTQFDPAVVEVFIADVAR